MTNTTITASIQRREFIKREIETSLKENGIAILPPMDALESLQLIASLPFDVKCSMLDPWYNKGVGGSIEWAQYRSFICSLLNLSARFADHIYLWGFPEIVARFVDNAPTDFSLNAWLTWYYKNNPSVIRGWRSSQNACLHFTKDGATLYPEHFLNEKQKEKQKQGKLRYIPGPTSVLDDQFDSEDFIEDIDDVIEVPLLVGFVGKNEQTGHPAQKPVKVFEKLILMTTLENDIVFDPMSGSGTTGVAARNLGRHAILCDISEEYIKIMERRLGVQRISIT
jgi:site-specific DNA-methyltransferase (adenine-specific)